MTALAPRAGDDDVALLSPAGAAAIVKLARPGFWPTHLWFFLLPLAEREMFGRWEFWLGCTYVCFPLGFFLYAWNDLFDVATDANNPRKDSWLFGARPGPGLRAKIPALLIVTQLPFVVAFVLVDGPRMLAWFAALTVANALYNLPRFGFKNWAGLDLANQVAYLLVFVLASWLCDVPQLSTPALVFSALFAMHSHLFGQLMDVDADRAAGRHSTAVVLGVRGGKLLLVAFLAVEAALAARSFSGPFVAAFMGAGALYFLVDALFGPKTWPQWFNKLFFLGWNAIVLGSMYFVWRYGVFLTR